MNKVFVTGAAGFVGSNLVDRLLANGVAVIGWDNFSTGQELFLENALKHPNFRTLRGDNLDLKGLTDAKHRVEVYNLGTPEYCRPTESIRWICDHLGLNPKLEFSGGDRGWVGDNPFIFLETQKMQRTGWRARLTIREGILRTLDWLRKESLGPCEALGYAI